jgi:hypothetical protein
MRHDRLEPLDFAPSALFLVGSPLGMFLSIRRHALGEDFVLPSCARLCARRHRATC